jgi:hypothetical protein
MLASLGKVYKSQYQIPMLSKQCRDAPRSFTVTVVSKASVKSLSVALSAVVLIHAATVLFPLSEKNCGLKQGFRTASL